MADLGQEPGVVRRRDVRRAEFEAKRIHAGVPFGVRRFRALDGLRGVAILSVLLYHSNWSPRGLFGVDVFFVVSGFFVTMLLVRELRQTGGLSVRRFYARRAKRLLPGVVVVVALAVIVVWQLGSESEFRSTVQTALFSLAGVGNWHQITSDTAYWNAFGTVSPLAHLWSLSVTVQFYVVWPLVLLALWLCVRGRLAIVGLAVAGLLAILAALAPFLYTGANAERLYLGTDSRAVAPVAGALAALVIVALERSTPWRPSAARAAVATALSMFALTVLVAVSVGTPSYQDPWLFQGGLAVVALAAALLAGSLCIEGNALARLFAWRPLAWVGRVSFPLFLVHLPVYWVLQTASGGEASGLALFALGALASFALAAGLHVLVTDRLRRVTWKPAVIAPAFSVVAVAAVACALWPISQRGPVSGPMELAQQPGDSAPKEADPVGGRTGLRPVVLTFGDSTAHDFARMLGVGSGKFSFRDHGYGGCGLFDPDEVRTATGFRLNSRQQGCLEWPSRLERALADEKPDVVLVHAAWDAAEQRIGADIFRPCSQPWRERYEQKLETLRTVTARSANEPVLLIANDRLSNSVVGDPGAMGCYNTVVADFVARHPGVFLVDWAQELCPGRQCHKADSQGRSLYMGDDVHMSDAGLAAFAPWLEVVLSRALGQAS